MTLMCLWSLATAAVARHKGYCHREHLGVGRSDSVAVSSTDITESSTSSSSEYCLQLLPEALGLIRTSFGVRRLLVDLASSPVGRFVDTLALPYKSRRRNRRLVARIVTPCSHSKAFSWYRLQAGGPVLVFTRSASARRLSLKFQYGRNYRVMRGCRCLLQPLPVCSPWFCVCCWC